MRQRRWINHSQPQTLQGAVLFAYLNAGLALVYTLALGLSLFTCVFVLLAVAAYGIANDRKLAYWAGLVLSFVYVLGELALLSAGEGVGGVLNLLFAGVLVVLLLHPESRRYQQTWFR